MKIYDIKGMSCRFGMAAMVLAASAALVSCGDDEPATGPQVSTEPKAESATTAAGATATVAPEEQMLDILLYKVVNRLSTGGLKSPFSAELRDILSLLNEYYDINGAKLTGTPKKVQLALLIAEMRLNFRGYAEAVKEYDRALADFNAMAEADRKNPEYAAWLSSLYFGKSSAQLGCGQREAALETAQLRLKADLERYEANPVPDKPNSPVTPHTRQAAEDILSSYRVLAEMMMNSDPEEARDIFAKGVQVGRDAGRVGHINVQMQYVRLLNAAAGHENACGQKQKAFEYYTEAMKRCAAMYQASQDKNVRNAFASIYNSMNPLVADLKKELSPETPEEPAQEALPTETPEDEPAAEPAL